MALSFPPNVKVDIYRGCNTGSPYTFGGPAAISGQPGYLQSRAQTGRHGTALYLKWTHILYLDATVDIRDAYNTQLNGITNANADTVVVKYSKNATILTAFYVAFVELALRGTALANIRAYLDRFQPASWPTDGL